MNIISRKKSWRYLRGIMKQKNVNQLDFKKTLGREDSYIEQRFACRHQWTIKDCYSILDYLGINHSELNKVFPSDPYQEC